ncbi:MAG TPA: response regulator transcription factor [Vicinamibacteria bacterium]|nr:response regulator transcription factor [Vicinamibacteria bacterium]
MPRRILLVEDEPALALTVEDRLASEGYHVDVARDGESGLARALSQGYDAIVLDLMLPRKNGFDVCRELRARDGRVPVLMLTARGQIEDKVAGLRLGADDYLVKPFHMSELVARIEALLRRRSGDPAAGATVHEFGDVRVDFRKAEVHVAGRPVELSAKELQLLRYFLAHRGETLSRNELLDAVWGWNATPTTRTVDVHVAGLRRKLEKEPRVPRHILTLHGLGYKFVE